jgi:hypothetical protein
MEILLIILVSYGISNVIVFGTLFESFRELMDDLSPNFFGKLFSCMMCTPWWVGFFLISGTTWLIHTIQEHLES